MKRPPISSGSSSRKASKSRPLQSPLTTHFNDTWGFNLHVVVGGTSKRACRLFSKKTGAQFEQDAYLLGFHASTDRRGHLESMVYVALREQPWKDQMVDIADIISHEALHCAVSQLSRRGLTLTKESEEAYAYTTGWIGMKIMQTIMDLGGK